MTDWKWRQTADLPSQALVVASRTEYNADGWNEIKTMLVPSYYRLLGDPNVMGVACAMDERYRVLWSVSAFPDYPALERCIQEQMEWLRNAVEKLNHNIKLRHQAYRFVDVANLPLPWTEVEELVNTVREVSPLGADAFPKLSELLGMDPV